MISVIIPVWIPEQAKVLLDLTRRAVESVRQHSPECEIVIVDNASALGVGLLKEWSDIYLRNEINLGYAPAVNRGITAASNDFVIVLNNDAAFVNDWATKATSAWRDGVGLVSAIGGNRQEIEPPRWFGACWMTNKKVLNRIGKLDESYKQGFFEDLDLVMRAINSGYKLIGTGSVLHEHSASWHWYKGPSVWDKNGKKFWRKWGNMWPWQRWDFCEGVTPEPIKHPERVVVNNLPAIKVVVTTLDNLPNLKETVSVLRSEPIDEIIIVNNGSEDGTQEWLETQSDLAVINRKNNGAGPGRNAGLDAAGEFDYVLMLDGGIRPLRGGTIKLLDYLNKTPNCDVIGIEIADFETDSTKAWRRWPDDIPVNAYQNLRLSHTAYALCKARAWDNLRFSENGPFAKPGWGADDDEMIYQWRDAGIVVHVATGIHPYRRASGSFGRLMKETGVGAIAHGSVYEQRLCWLKQKWPQYEPPGQWGEPWLTVVIKASTIDATARLVKSAHDQLRLRRFEGKWCTDWNPYHIIVWNADEKVKTWSEPRRLRQHHGDTIIIDGEIVRKDDKQSATWTGDFVLSDCANWQDAVRPTAHYYGLVTNQSELNNLIETYNEAYPHKPTKQPPEVTQWQLQP